MYNFLLIWAPKIYTAPTAFGKPLGKTPRIVISEIELNVFYSLCSTVKGHYLQRP